MDQCRLSFNSNYIFLIASLCTPTYIRTGDFVKDYEEKNWRERRSEDSCIFDRMTTTTAQKKIQNENYDKYTTHDDNDN